MSSVSVICFKIRFAPRIRDLADRRLYVADARADHGVLKPMIGGVVNLRVIERTGPKCCASRRRPGPEPSRRRR